MAGSGYFKMKGPGVKIKVAKTVTSVVTRKSTKGCTCMHLDASSKSPNSTSLQSKSYRAL